MGAGVYWMPTAPATRMRTSLSRCFSHPISGAPATDRPPSLCSTGFGVRRWPRSPASPTSRLATGGPGAAGGPVLNPSYFAPYEYRIFAQEDHAHPWGELVDTSYRALQACTDAPLDSGAGQLPPNWCALDVATGAAHPAPGMSRGSDYGYDAFRVMWRVALDARWNLEPRAVRYLSSHKMVLLDSWHQQGKLASEYGHDGAVRNPKEDPTVYGGAIASFLVVDRNAADQMLSRMEATATRGGQDGTYFGTSANYYEQNWVWFGLAFAYGTLPNLDR